jgi:drug/metabolite transporter (DMT)-like permease
MLIAIAIAVASIRPGVRRWRRLAAERRGLIAVVFAAAAFATLSIFGKLAAEAGASLPTLLTGRFTIAAVVLWVLVARRQDAPALDRRTVRLGLLLGAGAYSVQAGLFLGAVQRIDAPLAALLMYTYPALVTVGAVLLRRERLSVRRGTALLLASTGTVLVLVAGGAARLDVAGIVLALAAAVAYAAYILAADSVLRTADPLALAALICSGAAVACAAGGASTGALSLDFAPSAWIWVVAVALASTVFAIGAFLTGVSQLGPSKASILSTFEPLVTVALAFAVFGTALAPAQIAGGLLVLAGALVLQVRLRRPGRARPGTVAVTEG